MTPRRQQFGRDGFVLERVLTDAEVEDFRRLMAELLDPTKTTASKEVACSSILHAYHIPAVLEIVEELLGPHPIINNASIFATNPGVAYSLGWHRDIIQIPQDEIRDELFSPAWPHNSVQINLPLYEEQSLWVVPGSHMRPNTPEEDAAFGGSKHYAPTDAVMPGGIPVKIPAGHALLYNNNLIHRGYNAGMGTPRRTLHMGYHSATRKPTWHFYLLPLEPISDPSCQARLQPRIREMVGDDINLRHGYPRMEDTWQPGWPGAAAERAGRSSRLCPSSRLRYSPGGIPNSRRNSRTKWLWSQKP